MKPIVYWRVARSGRMWSFWMNTGIILSFLCSTRLDADELLGARQALDRIVSKANTASAADPEQESGAMLENLSKQYESLSPEAAAEAWLTVFDQWKTLRSRNVEHSLRITPADLIDRLPVPEAWPSLAKLIDARPVEGSGDEQISAIALRMLGHRLTNNTDALKQDLVQAHSVIADKTRSPNAQGIVGSVIKSLIGDDNSDSYKASRIRENLLKIRSEHLAITPLEVLQENIAQLESDDTDIVLPDIVPSIGRDAAVPIIEDLLLKRALTIECEPRYGVRQESETTKLMRELTRKHIGTIRVPQWQLCRSIDTSDLFEAFAAMSNSTEGDSYARVDAAVWYFMGLVMHDRTTDAREFLKELAHGKSPQAFGAMAQSLTLALRLETPDLNGPKFHTFLYETLRDNPDMELWDTLQATSITSQQKQQLLNLIDSTLAGDAISQKLREELSIMRIGLLIAGDRVDEGVDFISQLLKTDWKGNSSQSGEENEGLSDYAVVQSLVNYLQIATLLDRVELQKQSMEAMEVRLRDRDIFMWAPLVEHLIDANKLEDAERILIDLISQEIDAANDGNSVMSGYGNTPNFLAMLLHVYARAGRHADVIDLLENAPWWECTDLSELIRNHNSGIESESNPIALITARALKEVGRSQEAMSIIDLAIHELHGSDTAWQLALELKGDAFVAFAEEQFAEDPLEERPLIWQARYELDHDNLDRAEKLLRQAIAIDPSDGEQGPGDRMRAYAFLAETLHRKNDDKQAEIYDGAIKAVRRSEEADKYYHAGLHARAIAMYQESLTYFDAAYCIQSRLAIQLSDAGDFATAAKHYERAFQLMPESFGRVLSHCLGCEGVFSGELAEKTADRVLRDITQSQPTNARAHFLLGELLQTSEPDEAVRAYRQAVTLDPDYLDAWNRLAQMSDPTMTKESREEAIFQVLRLDPNSRHKTVDFLEIQDLARLATVLRGNKTRRPPVPPAQLLPLKVAKRITESSHIEGSVDHFQDRWESGGTATLSSQRTLQAISGLLDNLD